MIINSLYILHFYSIGDTSDREALSIAYELYMLTLNYLIFIILGMNEYNDVSFIQNYFMQINSLIANSINNEISCINKCKGEKNLIINVEIQRCAKILSVLPSIGWGKEEWDCLVRMHISNNIKYKSMCNNKVHHRGVKKCEDQCDEEDEKKLNFGKSLELDSSTVSLEIKCKECKKTQLKFPIEFL